MPGAKVPKRPARKNCRKVSRPVHCVQRLEEDGHATPEATALEGYCARKRGGATRANVPDPLARYSKSRGGRRGSPPRTPVRTLVPGTRPPEEGHVGDENGLARGTDRISASPGRERRAAHLQHSRPRQHASPGRPQALSCGMMAIRPPGSLAPRPAPTRESGPEAYLPRAGP